LKHIKWIVDLVIITLFVLVAAGIITSIAGHLLYKHPEPSRKVDISTSGQNKNKRGVAYYNVIKERDLLQVVKTDTTRAESPIEKDVVRPVAELGLTLRGTIVGPKEIARAIIEEKGKQELYRQDDEIKGARILAIYRNKVIMNVDGQEQMLLVEESKGRTSPSARSATRSPSRTTRPSIPSGMSDIMSNLDEYIGKARVIPYFKGGEPYGFRVSNVDKESIIYELGVRSGDILRSVNNIPIRTPEDAFKAYQDLQNDPSVEVEIERGGQPTTLTVPLQ